MAHKGEVLVSRKNFCCLEKLVCHLNNYIMKTILSDAGSREEHDETKCSPIEQMMAELWMI